MILGTINCQKLSLNSTDIVADTIDFIEARFVFLSDDWDGLEKWAHFARNGEVYDIRLTDDHIRKEDHLNLSSGKWKVYIHGNEFRGGEVVQRVTTNMVTLYVEPTGTLEGEPFPEVPASVTEQILARLSKVEQNGGGSCGIDRIFIMEGVSSDGPPTYTLNVQLTNGSVVTCQLPNMGIELSDVITVSPSSPITSGASGFVGKLWFDTTDRILYVCISSSNAIGAPNWLAVGGGGSSGGGTGGRGVLDVVFEAASDEINGTSTYNMVVSLEDGTKITRRLPGFRNEDVVMFHNGAPSETLPAPRGKLLFDTDRQNMYVCADISGNGSDTKTIWKPISASGVHVGSGTPPKGTRVWVNPAGKRSDIPQIDDTLTQPGYAADAAKVGKQLTDLSKEKANLTAVPNAASVDGKTLKMQRTTTTTAEDGTETTETKDLFNVELPEGGGEDVVRKTGWNPNKYLGTNEDGVVVEKPAPDGTGGEITEEVTKLKNRLFKVDGDLCVEFEQGGLSGADYKTENTSRYWIRSTEYIKREYIKSASVNDGYRIWSYHYDANMNYVGFNNNGIASPASAGVYVRVLINHNDGVTPESDHGFAVVSTVNDLGKQIETATFETRMANCVVEMEQGTLTHIGGNEYDATHYIRNKGFIPYNSAYKITANPEYSGYVFLYDEEKQPIEVVGGASYCAKLPVGFGEYEIPYHENAVYVRFSIQNSTGTAITPTDNHGVRLHGASRYRYERDRIVRNFLEQIKYQMPIVSACVGTTSAGHFKTDIGAVCITDLHGALRSLDDAYQVRENIASYNMGGDLPILNAGDMFPGVAKENGAMVSAYDEYIEKAVAYGVYHTMGQHEVGFYDTEEGRSKARCLTHDEVFEKFISPMKDVWELPDLTTNYYCKDFVASKTRLISLYQYNIPLVEETSDRWTYPRAAVWYGQEQLDWLVNTLLSTPDGYRVIVLMHQPEKDIVRSDKGGFFTGESVGGGNIIIDGTPIVDILDAYATRTSLSKTYVCKDKTRYPESDFSNTVNADFRASKGLFCNYITGDAHVDYIGVVEGTGQNNIGLTSSGQCYDAVVLLRDYGTIASEGNNPESSIVTVLGYDHNRRMIRIGRLGQQFASDGSTRMYTAISY